MSFAIQGVILQSSLHLIEVIFQSARDRKNHNSQWRLPWVLKSVRDIFRQVDDPTDRSMQLFLVQSNIDRALQDVDDLVFVMMDV